MSSGLHEALERRERALLRVLKALEHLPRERAIAILVSYFPIQELEDEILPILER